jgi:hypothetical protein
MNWKKHISTITSIVLVICTIASFVQKNYQEAIFFLLLVIGRLLDEIHDTIKEAFGIKG